MFFHDKRLQYHARPDKPDPLFAMKLQEVIGGQWGEMSVAMQYLFQGWNCRGPAKYRDMLMDIATEEIGHIEMLATMVAHLLEGADAKTAESAAKSNSLVGAIMGGTNPKDMMMAAGMNPQHLIVSGQGAMPADSVGNRWTASYIVASGNLLADFRMNVTAESQGRLQVARLYNMTEDKGIRDMLSFLLARDTMHQNQWLAAIEELRADGLEDTPCPSNFPQDLEAKQFSYQFINCSAGTESAEGRWAQGEAPDGKGTFQYVANPTPQGEIPNLNGGADPMFYGTPKKPQVPAAR
ncbi:MAG TPA: manganese catalase family protein [Tepidisphaeraceae bacterium]|jgi:Mn-containing catalase